MSSWKNWPLFTQQEFLGRPLPRESPLLLWVSATALLAAVSWDPPGFSVLLCCPGGAGGWALPAGEQGFQEPDPAHPLGVPGRPPRAFRESCSSQTTTMLPPPFWWVFGFVFHRGSFTQRTLSNRTTSQGAVRRRGLPTQHRGTTHPSFQNRRTSPSQGELCPCYGHSRSLPRPWHPPQAPPPPPPDTAGSLLRAGGQGYLVPFPRAAAQGFASGAVWVRSSSRSRGLGGLWGLPLGPTPQASVP